MKCEGQSFSLAHFSPVWYYCTRAQTSVIPWYRNHFFSGNYTGSVISTSALYECDKKRQGNNI